MATMTRSKRTSLACSDGVTNDFGCSARMDLSAIVTTPRNASLERIDQLRRTIESEIIPRLMLTNQARQQPLRMSRSKGTAVESGDVAEFTNLLLEGRLNAAVDIVACLVDGGVTRSAILLDLFAPASKRLGELWETDDCTFADVTMAMGTLQQAFRLLQPDNVDHSDRVGAQPSIMLVPASGEQHVFPIQMLEFFFQRAGWAVESDFGAVSKGACATLRRRHFDVIGLSISCDALIDQLASDIQTVRRASRNKAIVVLVGGRVLAENPERAAALGADGTANDASWAVQVAESLVPNAAGASR